MGRIVYGVCVGPSGKFEVVCRPSLPVGATVITREGQRSIFEAYNSILEQAAAFGDLAAVALIHDDVEVGAAFEDDVRRALTPGVGVAGAIGARRNRSIAWWVADTRGYARVAGGEIVDLGAGVHDVDMLDGYALIVSAECARRVRFDDRRYRGFHGYDADYCRAAKTAGFGVVVAPLDCVHHASGAWAAPAELMWRRADLVWRRKWRTVGRPRLVYLWVRYLMRWAKAAAGVSLAKPKV